AALGHPVRAACGDELLRLQVDEAMELPPRRFLLAAVPTEKLGEQPSRSRTLVFVIARDLARFDEAVDELLEALLGGGELCLDLGALGRSRNGLPGQRLELVA